MSRYHCPACEAPLPDGAAGRKVFCGRCGQKVFVPRDERQVTRLALPVEEVMPPLPGPRPRFWPRALAFLVLLALIGGVTFGVAHIMRDAARRDGPAAPVPAHPRGEVNPPAGRDGPNARCPHCGFEWRVAKGWQGGNAAWMREVRCPGCGVEWPEAMVLK
jgi:DNA-directed RNA polymerase subunit RPC12/RpoP